MCKIDMMIGHMRGHIYNAVGLVVVIWLSYGGVVVCLVILGRCGCFGFGYEYMNTSIWSNMWPYGRLIVIYI